jgi:transcription elongation factor GreA
MPTYISQEGLEELKEELKDREKNKRYEIADKIADAKELGDLSENFEYKEAKDQQAANEARIAELKGMIQDAVVVEKKSGGDTVEIGATVIVEHGDKEREYEITGTTENNPLEGKISNESPLGQALLGRKVGEVAEVDAPSGTIEYTIKEIK